MSDDVVIQAESLSKKYSIGRTKVRPSHPTLRDEAMRSALKVAGVAKRVLFSGRKEEKRKEEFWALKDVSFQVNRGDVLGIIGRNGAGKSTLLKILSRITEPSTGRVVLNGRVASLLEVGTGFHPELSGRENIFLNGAIIGMSREEVRRKFDEIVAFAEVERFLDTSVKRYSSGMYVRLAFAVAAHLEPEILIVDEVLAVGDAEFQRKCLGKMSEVSTQGRTVLFVSHNMAAVESLCTKGMFLSAGRISAVGSSSDAIRAYLSSVTKTESAVNLSSVESREGEGRLRFSHLSVYGTSPDQVPVTGGELNIKVEIGGVIGSSRASRVGVGIASALGSPLIVCSTELTCSSPPKLSAGDSVICRIPRLPLSAGSYLLTLFIEQAGVVQDWLQDISRFEVRDADYYGFGRNVPFGHEAKVVLVEHSWIVQGEKRRQ